MATYRLWPSTNGGALVSFAGAFIAGTTFQVTPGVKWLDGYWWWVPTGGDTAAQKFALWVETTNSTGSVVAGSVVTSGTLSATPTGGESGGHWNFVALPISIPLAPGTAYIAATGWTAVNGFPDTSLYWGSGPGTNGIVNGPLIAFSSATSGGTSNKAPYAGGQGVFSTAGTDPSLVEPLSQSGSDNFWVDVQVNDSPPAAYTGSYRLWPNNTAANEVTVTDAAINYDVATEFALSAACTLNKIWYFSPSGVTQLATAANIWSITAPGTSGTLVATSSSPSWSGAAGSGWVSCSFSGVTLATGKYKVSVYNGAATPAGWNAKDANTDYWRNGAAASGISNGPLSAPNLANASTAFNYNGNAGGTPPFSDGTTLAGQPTFTQGPPDSYPYLVALVTTPTAGSTQNYWVDVEVTPIPVPSEPVVPVPWQFTPHAAPGEPFTPWPPWPQAAQASAAAVPLTDSGAATETLAVSAAIPLADAGTGADALAPTAGVALTDTGTGADALTAGIPVAVTDTGTATDALGVTGTAALTDTGTGAETLAVAAAVPVAETGAAADFFSAGGTAAPLTDAGVATDALLAQIAAAATDTGTGADAVTMAAATACADSGTAADTFALLMAISLADAGAALESLAAGSFIPGVLTASDAPTGTLTASTQRTGGPS